MYNWRYLVKLVMSVLLISCSLCVLTHSIRMLFYYNQSSSKSGDLNRKLEAYSLKLKEIRPYEISKYQQQRRRIQRELSQQPAGHCFHIWEESNSALAENDLNNICSNENWSLLDHTWRTNKTPSSFFPSPVFSPESTNFLSYGPHRRLTTHNLHSFKRMLHKKYLLSKNESSCFQRWMTLLRHRLGNTRLGDLMIPGTHNSASFSVSPNGTLIEKLWVSRLALSLGFHDYFSSWARNHDDSILAQLNAGYRCLDLRVAVLPNGGFYWWHGISGEAIDSALKDIADFARRNPGEIIILLISHLNAPGDGEMEKLPMPYHSKLKLGRHLLSILGSTLVPTSNISLNPTISSVLTTGRNVIALIRDDLDLVNAFPEYFWSDVNNQTAVEFFERKTNPRSMFHHRSDIMQRYKHEFADRMSITPAFVTHNVPNILGGLLRSSCVGWILTFVFIFTFYTLATLWPYRRFRHSTFYCRLEFRNVVSVKCWGRATKIPVKFVLLSVLYTMVISLSVSLAHLQQRTILHFFGFEGKATNLLEMARIANLCGDDASRPVRDIMYQSINSMIRHWSDREQEYRLNIVLVDDFSSSQVVQTAIQENIRRTHRLTAVRSQQSHLQKDDFNKDRKNKNRVNSKRRSHRR